MEAKQREIERLKAEKDALADRERKEVGARRTNADKRRAVEMAFRWLIEEGRSLKSITDTEIAKMASVSKMTASRLRDQIVCDIGANVTKLQVPEVTKSEAKELTVTQRLKEKVKRG